jgi:hypothetical protein
MLKNAVITQGLRSTFAAQRVGNTRGALEAQADSLVADYIRQMDFEIVTNAARMSEFYKLFYALENDMRELIEAAMADAKGEDWWKIAVPQVVRENVQKKKDNWDVFSGMFSNATKNRVLRVISRLNMARGPIAHCNMLPEEEAIRLKLAIRDWYKLME